MLEKMSNLFFLGELVGLPTLHSILSKFGISSNHLQKNYKALYDKLSINKIRQIFEYVFESQLRQILEEMSKKDNSIWSKKVVTLVLDDSIFRQWLQSQFPEKDWEGFYGCFFSGQYKATVYGFKVVSLGVCIDGVFHPLYFEFVKKMPKTASKEDKRVESAVKVAEKLIRRWTKFKKSLSSSGVDLPKLHLSCDNGYSDMDLAKVCDESDLIYISVPKKSHLFEIKGQKIKLSDWIEKEFLEAEKTHLLQSDEPFIFRFQAKYYSKDSEVTLLAFRLNGSKKVSVIYSTNKYIFAKTLRRHWFQRTYIEQFFKMLKHVLKISEARVRTKAQFENKLWHFAFMALQAEKLVRFIRRQCKEFNKKGFIFLQRMLCSDPDFLDLLHTQIHLSY
jgi:hypothetical protein